MCEELVEPSSSEQAEWPDRTRQYVEGLGSRLDVADVDNTELRSLLDSCSRGLPMHRGVPIGIAVREALSAPCRDTAVVAAAATAAAKASLQQMVGRFLRAVSSLAGTEGWGDWNWTRLCDDARAILECDGDAVVEPPKDRTMKTDFERELGELINKHSQENNSNTPDFVLARFMRRCLDAFDAATVRRDQWYGDMKCPAGQKSQINPEPVDA
jgi:hypothetical protein